MFKFEAAAFNGGFSFTGTFGEIIDEIRSEYGMALVSKVRSWKTSEEPKFMCSSFTISRL